MSMIKLQTPVTEDPRIVRISYEDKILLLGSCFSDNIGGALVNYGFDALVNPFGTLYNPASIVAAVERLASGEEFTLRDCVPMGSGADRICSFSHHTSFARKDASEFLENANASLSAASKFFRDCNKVIITLGTAWCYRFKGVVNGRTGATGVQAPDAADPSGGPASVISNETIDNQNIGKIVSNCLKRDNREFSRERLSVEDCVTMLSRIIALCEGGPTDRRTKEIIFTVSPIRHLADGAHGNQLSKSTLLLAVDAALSSATLCDYFPAYEIMMDELRDYRFYTEDMLHPSQQAVNYITERFLDHTLVSADKPLLEDRIRIFRRSQHRPLL